MSIYSPSEVSPGQCQSTTSSSRCFREIATATHYFEVADYLLTDGMGAGKSVWSTTFRAGGYNWEIRFYPDGSSTTIPGKSVCSTTFRAGGYNWEIRFYPDGSSTTIPGKASAFLYYLSPEKDVRAKFSLNAVEKDGKAQITNFDVEDYSFSPASNNRGYTDFLDKSRLKAPSQVNNSYITIRCVVTVIKEPRTVVKRNPFEAPRPTLQDNLEHMWKEGEGRDVTFNVCGHSFNAHRCVLAARSSVFRAELFGPMKEKTTQCITIDDIEPQIFEALLHFVYTDSMKHDDHNEEGRTAKFQHLLVAADRYGLERLKIMCQGRLCESIDVETVATTLVLAEQHHCNDLKVACIGFMASPDMLYGKSWQRMDSNILRQAALCS